MISAAHLLQIGVPSRTKVASYRAIEHKIDRMVADINRRHAGPDGREPIRYRKSSLKLRRLVALFCLADVCERKTLAPDMVRDARVSGQR